MGLPGPEEIKSTTSWPKASTWPPEGPRGAENREGDTDLSSSCGLDLPPGVGVGEETAVQAQDGVGLGGAVVPAL